MYATHILEEMGDETPSLEDYQVLQEFQDVFPDEIPRLPPKRDIDFTIELVPGAAPVSEAPYKMSTPEMLALVENERLVNKRPKILVTRVS